MLLLKPEVVHKVLALKAVDLAAQHVYSERMARLLQVRPHAPALLAGHVWAVQGDMQPPQRALAALEAHGRALLQDRLARHLLQARAVDELQHRVVVLLPRRRLEPRNEVGAAAP